MMQDLETPEPSAGKSRQLLRRCEVEDRVKLSTSAIYRRMAIGTFPKPVDLGGGVVRWRESDIDEWDDALTKPEYRQPDQDAA